jgi:hypothetical protein
MGEVEIKIFFNIKLNYASRRLKESNLGFENYNKIRV